LLGAGFASNKLALSVVIDRRGNNHVVLLARLRSGDYVLDNLAGKVKP
jgi:predicted transglutaminase-like cysteine proteinase